jgi:hypothetical protein
MKLNLLLDNPGDCRSGYLNVDPFAPESAEDGRVRGDLLKLTEFVDLAEVEEVVALDVLDYFPGHALDEVLSHWLSLLAHGGKLTMSVIDVKEVARAVLANTLSAEDVDELLHGKQEKDWQLRKSSFTLKQLSDVLEARGYKVLARRVQNYRAVVTVQRP